MKEFVKFASGNCVVVTSEEDFNNLEKVLCTNV